jgi:oligoendopeptidase F
MSDARGREAMPDRYRWDVSALFESDREWERAFERYEERVNRLSFDERVADDPDALARALERRDDLQALGSRLGVYAECRAWADVTDETARARVRRVERVGDRRDAAFRAFESALRAAGRDCVEALVGEHPDLAPYEHYLDDVFRRAAYALDPAAEAAVADLGESLDASARTLRAVADRAFEPPTVTPPDGDEVRLTKAARFEALAHPDRAYRRRAYEAYRDALREHREVVAQAYVDHVRSHAARARVRGYESPLAASMDGLVPPSALRSLVEGVREHREAFCERYVRLRDRIGVTVLRPWDRRAPLADGDGPEIPYDEATGVVLEAVAPLGDGYRDSLAEFLDARRVDVYPTERKRDVPAVMFGTNGASAFVHLNYAADLESLYLFAHELAHVMHYRLARAAQPPTYRRLSWHVGEVPSFVHELLLTDHLLASDRVADAAVLDVALRRLSPLAEARGAAFTRRVLADVEADADLAADDIDDYHRETGNAFFEGVAFRDGDGHGWLNLNLDRDPFHAHWYLLGRTCALAVAGRLRRGDLDAETYRGFLRAGDSAYPMDLLATLGLDLESGSVVETAAGEYGRLVDAV